MTTGPDLNEIAVFARVVETGSFTRAAAALGMPKSTVSRKVADLEARLRARLLQRTTRKLHLTDAGRTFHAYCARIVAELDEAERAVGSLQAVPRGRLRVTTPLNLSFLGPILSDFAKRYPEVVLDVVATDRVVGLIDEGFDVAIRAAQLVDSTLVARKLGSVGRVLVAGARYLKKHGTPRAPADLANHAALVFGAGASPTTWRLARRETGSASVDVVVTPRMVINDFDALVQAARADLGIALLPTFLGVAETRSGRLEHVLKDWSTPPTMMHVVYPSTRHPSPKVTAFVEHMKESFTPPPWELGPRP
jgi:DNA-binding transcriptional LysR family regulator